jgi:radical SAM superfamily enzyme YgiQ (UPF0313 family)
MNKVMFIVPPDTMSIEASMSKTYGEKERGYYPKLGVLYVAAHFEQATGRRPMFVDCPANGLGYEELGERLEECEPDLVGVSVLTFNILDALRSARLVKAADPATKVCFGGMHVGLYPRETLELPEVDYVVHGEGERPFAWLVEALQAGASSEQLAGIPGIGWKEDGESHLNPARDQIPDLDELPFPARHLIDLEKYSHILATGNVFSTIQSSRGCAFGCTFCDIRRTKFRARTPENVLEEIRSLVDQGVDDLFFVDDTITIQKERVHEICRLIMESGLKLHFKISARVDTITRELLDDLRKAGCYRIHYGVETATPRLLKYMDKGITVEQVERAFQLTKAAGIETLAYMMIGIPTETYQEMQDTVDFAVALQPDYAQFSICTPYPKTELYLRLVREGVIPDDYWQRFAENPTPDFRVRFWNPDFSEDALRKIQDNAHQRFYRRPSYMLKELMKVRSWAEFNAKVRMGGRMLLKVRGAGVTEPPEVYINTASG